MQYLNSETHHVLDDVSQCSSFDVLSDEVEPFVFVEDANKLQHVRMVQTSHHLHLNKHKVMFTINKNIH